MPSHRIRDGYKPLGHREVGEISRAVVSVDGAEGEGRCWVTAIRVHPESTRLPANAPQGRGRLRQP